MFFSNLLLHIYKSSIKSFPDFVLWTCFPAFIGWCALICGIIMGYSINNFNGMELLYYNRYIFFAIICLIAIAIVFSSKVIRSLCFFLLGILLAQHDFNNQKTLYAEWRNHSSYTKECRLSGKVLSIPSLQNGKYRFMVSADSLYSLHENDTLRNKCIICYSKKSPPAYGSVNLAGKFRLPLSKNNPWGFDDYLYCRSNSVCGYFTADTIISAKVSNSLLSGIMLKLRNAAGKALDKIHDDEIRGVVQAACLNEQENLSINMKKLFFEAGIYHLLALSGFNVAVLASAIFALLFLFPIKRTWKIIIVLAAIWLYLLFIGFIPSLFRAVIMTTIVSASFLFQRKSYMLNSLGIAGTIWLFMSPISLFTPGYQLSFSATFGLITLLPLFIDYYKSRQIKTIIKNFPPKIVTGIFASKFLSGLWAGKPAKKIIDYIILSTAISALSFITTLPFLIYHFKQIYMFGLFANIFAVALMSIALWFALAGFILQVIFPPVVPLCMYLSEWFMNVMIKGAGLVKFAPWSIIHLSLPCYEPYLFFSIFIIGIILIKKEFRIKWFSYSLPVCLLLSTIFIFSHISKQEAQIVSFSLKNNSLSAIKWPGGHLWLIGYGEDSPSQKTYSQYILPWKYQFMVNKIETIVIPHYRQNAVHFLEPLLINNPGLNVAYCDSAYSQDENFISMIESNGGKTFFLETKTILEPESQCTCKVINNGKKTIFILRIFNSTIYIPDSQDSSFEAGIGNTRMITVNINGGIFKTVQNSKFSPL